MDTRNQWLVVQLKAALAERNRADRAIAGLREYALATFGDRASGLFHQAGLTTIVVPGAKEKAAMKVTPAAPAPANGKGAAKAPTSKATPGKTVKVAPAPATPGKAKAIPSPSVGKVIQMRVGKYTGQQGKIARAVRLPNGGTSFVVTGLHDPKGPADAPKHDTTIREKRRGETWDFVQ